MATTDILRTRVEPFLNDGEVVSSIFTTGWGKHRLLGLWNYPPMGRCLIVAPTNHSLVALEAGRYRVNLPKASLIRLPRDTRIGPAVGWRRIRLEGLSSALGGYVFTFWEFRDEIDRVEPGLA